MAETVANELLERAWLAEQSQHGVGDRDAVGLATGADVVVHPRHSIAQRAVDAAGVVLDEEVVAHRSPIAVDGQRAVVDRVGDEERDDLLGVLERTVRIGAAGHDRRESVRGSVCLDLQLATGLARAVRASRLQWVAFDAQPVVDLAVHLVGAHLDEALVPVGACRVHEHERAEDIGENELTWCFKRAVDMGLGGEVDDDVDVGGQLAHHRRVADIAAHETESRIRVNAVEVALVAGIGELVEHDHGVARVVAKRHADEFAPDEARSPGDQEAHLRCSRWSSRSRCGDRPRRCGPRRGPGRCTAP